MVCNESNGRKAGEIVAKKPKTLETKLRSAIRLIWSRSSERRAIVKAALDAKKEFVCRLCAKSWPEWAGEVDHSPPIGPLENWRDVVGFIDRMFYGPQFLVCKPCHRAKTKEDRKAMKKRA